MSALFSMFPHLGHIWASCPVASCYSHLYIACIGWCMPLWFATPRLGNLTWRKGKSTGNAIRLPWAFLRPRGRKFCANIEQHLHLLHCCSLCARKRMVQRQLPEIWHETKKEPEDIWWHLKIVPQRNHRKHRKRMVPEHQWTAFCHPAAIPGFWPSTAIRHVRHCTTENELHVISYP